MERCPDLRRHPLCVLLIAIAVGIALDRWWPISLVAWWLLAVAALAAWWLLRHFARHRPAQVPLLFAAASLAGLWHHGCWNLFAADEFGRFATVQSRAVCVDAVTLALPRHMPAPPVDPMRIMPAMPASRVEVVVTAIRDGQAWRPCSGRTTLFVHGRMGGLPVGSNVRIFGTIARPRPAHNPGEFDFAAHARGERILARLDAPHPESVERLPGRSPWGIAAFFENARQRGHDVLWRHIEPSQAGLASAVLLGEREHIDGEQTAAYVETGTIHLLSISGMHLGIVAGFLFFILRAGVVPRRAGLVAIAAVVVMYARLTDAEPPVVRAALMVVVCCLAGLLGRRPLGWNTLAAAAIVVLAMNPAELFRVGTQLSFLCMAVLVAVDTRGWLRPAPDALARLLSRSEPLALRGLRWARRRTIQVVLLSLAVWLVTLPLVTARFHVGATVGILLNPIVAVPMAFAMLSGFLVLLVGGFVPWLGDLLGGVCQWNLELLGDIVNAGREVPGSRFWTPGPDDWWLAGFYLLLAVFVTAPGFLPMRHRLALLAVWVAAGFGAATWRAQPSGRLEVTFLSVGHGCATLIELPDGRNVLYDAGHMGSPESAGRSIAAALWSKGITRLDALVISHADADHYNAVPYLLERFDIRRAFVSPVMFPRDGRASPSVAAVEAAIDEAGVPTLHLAEGDMLDVGGEVTLRVLHPPPAGVPGNDNANSIVLAIEHRGRRMLLTGDLEGAGLRRLIRQPPYDCDVLLVPHHGSLASSPTGTVPVDPHKTGLTCPVSRWL